MFRVFLTSARLGSFTAAARALKIGQATVSRQVAALELALGHALFDRRPDGLSLTAAGEAAMPRAETMEYAALELRAALDGLEGSPAGVVRIAVPPGLGFDLVVPLARSFYPRYPDIRLELAVSLTNADLTRGEADLALRIVRPTEASLVVRTLGSFELGLWASPRYVAGLASDVSLGELDWIGWTDELAHLPMIQWVQAHAGVVQPTFASNSFPAQRRAAQAGLGVIAMPVIQAVITPGLVPVPVRVPPMPAGSLHLVIHPPLRKVPRVRAVADFLIDVLTMRVDEFAALYRECSDRAEGTTK